jgi:hypothetical protein
MDIDLLVNLTLQKIPDGTIYMEMPVENLEQTIRKYLTGFYQKKVRSGNIKLNLQKIKGKPVSEADYEEAVSAAQISTICQAYALAAVNHKDLYELSEMNKL